MVQYNARNSGNAANIGRLIGRLYGQGQRVLTELQKPIGTPYVSLEDRIKAETAYNNLTNAQKSRTSRRTFLYLAGALGVVTAVGLAACYVKSHLGNQTTTTTTSTLLDTTPPEIKDYKLIPNPDKVKNGKPYELDISFTAEDLASTLDLSAASLAFEPIYPPEIPKEAFTPEDPSFQTSYSLKPIAVSSDGRSASFSQAISGFKGGTRYRATIKIKDKTGNEAKSSVDNPYIRKFENITNKKCNSVAAAYYLFYNGDPWQWKTWTTPKFGKYRSDDPDVISGHIDIAKGYGTDTFFVSLDHEQYDQRFFTLFDNTLSKEMRFAVLYDRKTLIRTGNRVDFQTYYDHNLQIVKDDFDWLAKNFFSRSEFSEVDGRPVVYMFDSNNYLGDVNSVIKTLRKFIQDNHGIELYLVSDHIQPRLGNPNQPSYTKKIEPFDCITAWGGSFYGDGIYLGTSYEQQLELMYDPWLKWALRNDKGMIPSMKPGEDSRLVPWGGRVTLQRSQELFVKRLEILLKFQHPQLKSVRIDGFNEFYEHIEFEPTNEEGSIYVVAQKNTLTN